MIEVYRITIWAAGGALGYTTVCSFMNNPPNKIIMIVLMTVYLVSGYFSCVR